MAKNVELNYYNGSSYEVLYPQAQDFKMQLGSYIGTGKVVVDSSNESNTSNFTSFTVKMSTPQFIIIENAPLNNYGMITFYNKTTVRGLSVQGTSNNSATGNKPTGPYFGGLKGQATSSTSTCSVKFGIFVQAELTTDTAFSSGVLVTGAIKYRKDTNFGSGLQLNYGSMTYNFFAIGT